MTPSLQTKVDNMGKPGSVGQVELNTFTVRIVRTDNENAQYCTFKEYSQAQVPTQDPCTGLPKPSIDPCSD